MSTTTLGRLPAPVASTYSEVVRSFHPGWFGAVMGTGIVGVAAYLDPGGSHALLRPAHAVGVAIVAVAWLLAVAIAVPYLARLVRHPDASWPDLRHPLVGGLYATFPAALLVLAVATATVGGSVLPPHAVVAVVAVLAVLGSVLAVAIAIGFTYLLFSGATLATDERERRLVHPARRRDHRPAQARCRSSPTSATRDRAAAAARRLRRFGIGFFLVPARRRRPLRAGSSSTRSRPLRSLRRSGSGSARSASAASPFSVSPLPVSPFWGDRRRRRPARLHARRRRRSGASGSGGSPPPPSSSSAISAASRLPYGVGLWAFTFPLGAYTVATLQLARSWPTGALEWVGRRSPRRARRLLALRRRRHPRRHPQRHRLGTLACRPRRRQPGKEPACPRSRCSAAAARTASG